MTINLNEYKLNVIITNFVPPPISWKKLFYDYVAQRLTFEYFLSWARLLKHGTRGNQTWKLDVMTIPRRKRDKFREDYLAQVIKNFESLDFKALNIHVFSNKDFPYNPIRKSTSLSVYVYDCYKEMNQLNNSPWLEDDVASPWNLLWEHKEILKNFAGDRSEEKTLYLVSENDIFLSRENFEYWILNREITKRSGFIPSFVLVEYSQSSKAWLCPSIHNKKEVDLSKWSRVKIQGSEYLQVPSLYAGFFILDRRLLEEYVLSDAIDPVKSKSLTWWDKGARSAMGLQFVNIPSGFPDRYLIKVTDDRQDLEVGALAHHLPNLYVSVPEVSVNFPSISELAGFAEKTSVTHHVE
jgi:hypothetical protein